MTWVLFLVVFQNIIRSYAKKVWLRMIVLPSDIHVNLLWSINKNRCLLSSSSAMHKRKGVIRSPCLTHLEQEKNYEGFPFIMIDSLDECRMVRIQSHKFWSKPNWIRTLIRYCQSKPPSAFLMYIFKAILTQKDFLSNILMADEVISMHHKYVHL